MAENPQSEGHHPWTEGFLWRRALFPPFPGGGIVCSCPPSPSSSAGASVPLAVASSKVGGPSGKCLAKTAKFSPEAVKMQLLLGSAGGWIQDGSCSAPPPPREEAGGQVALPALLGGPSRLCGGRRRGPVCVCACALVGFLFLGVLVSLGDLWITCPLSGALADLPLCSPPHKVYFWLRRRFLRGEASPAPLTSRMAAGSDFPQPQLHQGLWGRSCSTPRDAYKFGATCGAAGLQGGSVGADGL